MRPKAPAQFRKQANELCSHVEPLESRRLLAVTALSVRGILAVLGDNGANEITLDVPEQLPKQLFSVFVLQPDGSAQEVNFDEGPLQFPLTPDKRPRKIAVALSLFQVISQTYDIAFYL